MTRNFLLEALFSIFFDACPPPLFDRMLTAPLLLKIVWTLMLVVFFPVGEETLFRGFLFTGLAQSWGPSVAGVLTTLAFVGLHLSKVLEYLPALVAVTLIGSLTLLIRIPAGNLASGIAMHCTYNGALGVAKFFSQSASLQTAFKCHVESRSFSPFRKF